MTVDERIPPHTTASTAAAMLNSRASPIVSPININPTGGSPAR